MPNIRQAIFPYGLQKNDDGSWTFFNRKYKPVGVVTQDWAEYDDPRHKLPVQLTKAQLQKLDVEGKGDGDTIYLYDDATNPERGGSALRAYLDRLAILLTIP